MRKVMQLRGYLQAACLPPVAVLYLLALFTLLIFSPEQAYAYQSGKFGDVCGKIITALATENFGSLLAALAGVGAIVASAMGGFKAAWSLLVVSVGSFILNEYIGIWFNDCQAGGGGA